jgi:hypothetical protein
VRISSCMIVVGLNALPLHTPQYPNPGSALTRCFHGLTWCTTFGTFVYVFLFKSVLLGVTDAILITKSGSRYSFNFLTNCTSIMLALLFAPV